MITGSLGFFVVVVLAVTLVILFQRPWFQQWFFRQVVTRQIGTQPKPPAGPEAPYRASEPDARPIRDAASLFRPAEVWRVHLRFTASQWETLAPRRIPPLKDWLRPDGTLLLRNPQASRAGVAGVLGIDLPWSAGAVDWSGVGFTNAGIRFKGNGTFLDSVGHYRRPFKIDLDRHEPGRRFAAQKTLNLHNLVADRSCLADTLAYEFFREAGVPAPRTTFARVFLSIEGRWEERLLGLYVVVENPDELWLADVFQSGGGALFKPVTLELFHDLGTEEWKPYAEIYDPKTPVTDAQRQRLFQLARLVSHADNAEFERRIGEFLDLDQVARFLACEVLLSNYDGILSNGQNFLLWIDPRTGLFGFSPWDLDHSWGEFGWMGSREDREQASIERPWVGDHRLFERLFPVEAFRQAYRGHLDRLLQSQFQPHRLARRIDELAPIIRPALEEQSAERLQNFEAAIADSPGDGAGGDPKHEHRKREPHRLKRFIHARAASVRDQLDGRSPGVILTRKRK